MKKTIDNEDLNKLLSEVQEEMNTLLKSEGAKQLAKSDDEKKDEKKDGPPEKSDDKSGPPAPAADASAPAADASAPAAPAPDASAAPAAPDASAPGAADPAAAAAGQDPAAAGDPAADAATDPQQLVAEYAQLPIEALKAHYLAAKMALSAMMGQAGAPGADASAGAPPPAAGAPAPAAAAPAAPAPMAAPAPDASAPPALKSEIGMDADNTEGNGDHPIEVSKSESDIVSLKKTIDEQNEALTEMFTVLKSVLEAPIRKSVTSAADLAKSSTVDYSKLSKQQIIEKLQPKLTSLTKAERDLVNSYVLGSAKADQVIRLLDK